MIGPATTRPSPPPTAVMAAMTPTPDATFLAGNSSRMMPNANGSTPPPMPWTARPITRTTIECARPDTMQPRPRAPSVATSIRSLPTMSPIRPMIGVAMDADRRYAVTTQVTASCEVWTLCWIVGSAGMTSDWSSA
jgi:hypothetical protein